MVGTCLQQDLGHAEQRVRREVQAHRRTVPQHHPHVVDRQLQPDHPDRRHRHHRRRQHAVHLRVEQPVLRQAPGRSRAAEPGARNSSTCPCRRPTTRTRWRRSTTRAIRRRTTAWRPATSRRSCFTLRGLPSNDLNATASIEVDSRYLQVRQISAGGSYNWSGRILTNAGLEQAGLHPAAQRLQRSDISDRRPSTGRPTSTRETTRLAASTRSAMTSRRESCSTSG